MRLLADMALRSSIVLLIGLVGRALLRHRSAAMRHWVLAGAVFAAAGLLPLTLVLPEWSVPSFKNQPRPSSPSGPPATSTHPLVNTSVETERANAVPLVLIVWIAGLAAGAVPLAMGIGRLARIGGRAERVKDDRWVQLAHSVSATYGLTRTVSILQTDEPDLLATWGLVRPCVLLPAHAREWSDDRVFAVLCHELAHIRRHDWFVQISAEVLRTVYWFNPLMWVACMQLRRDSELASDDMVLGAGVPAREYAAHLFDLAKICRQPRQVWASAMLMARPSTLERRIVAMLNPGLSHGTPSHRAIVMTSLLLVGVTLPIAAFRPAQTSPLPLSGSVYDTSGAVLPNVELTLAVAGLEDGSQVKSTVTTDAAGRFVFPSVQPGRYLLEASFPGFRALRHELELRSPRDWDRAITLQVGAVMETITVSGHRSGAASPTLPGVAPRPVRVGGNIRPPVKLYDVRPIYPKSMQEAGREGVVPIDAVIGRDGSVVSLRVLSAQVHPDFAMAAVDAVRQWRFDPTLLNGEPVEVVMTVSVTFKLSD
jgi:TonB family protein